jgi:hypothetical protein
MFNLLMPLAGLLGLEVEGLGQRLKGLAVVYAVILVFGAIGVGFLIAAGYIALAASVGPLYASLIFAGGFLAIALITLIGFSMAEAGRKRRIVEKRRSSDTGAFLTTVALTALPLLARSPLLLKLGIPAAAIAAVALLRDRNDHNS